MLGEVTVYVWRGHGEREGFSTNSIALDQTPKILKILKMTTKAKERWRPRNCHFRYSTPYQLPGLEEQPLPTRTEPAETPPYLPERSGQTDIRWCAACMDFAVDPMTLICSHTFCKSCLAHCRPLLLEIYSEQVTDPRTALRCPVPGCWGHTPCLPILTGDIRFHRQHPRFKVMTLVNEEKSPHQIMPTKEMVQRLFRQADAVCFDVDSTVCVDEAIDELAEFCGVGPEVAACTVKAMGGGMTFREALKQRLGIMQPSRKTVENFITCRPHRLSPGIRELIELLKAKNKMVFLVSGGFRNIISPVADELGIDQDHVFANKLLFDADGSYAGFDTTEWTSETGGKPRVVQRIKEKYDLKTLVFIGDGVTDLETCPPADAFIGYGGNVVRSKVQEQAAWYITDFKELIDELSDHVEH